MIKNVSKNENFTMYQYRIKPIAFEKFILYLFESLGYEVICQKRDKERYIDMELFYKKFGKFEKYVCEIKFFYKFYSFNRLLDSIKEFSKILKKDEVGLFVTNCLCSKECRKEALDKNIIILDITNLLYLTKMNNELYQSFLEFLDFSVSELEPTMPSIPFHLNNQPTNKCDEQYNWTKKFRDIKDGTEDFVKYQKICIEALKFLFSDYLSIWEEQKKSNDDLYRFDLICKIKNNIVDDFFETLNNYFNTRYVVFEFKNYSEKITQREIYTTEKYLYDKALRKVAIIISRKGIDENALKAVKGSLREQGKVILTLTDYDILEMIAMHHNGDNPTDYLSYMLDKLLIELEK